MSRRSGWKRLKIGGGVFDLLWIEARGDFRHDDGVGAPFPAAALEQVQLGANVCSGLSRELRKAASRGGRMTGIASRQCSFGAACLRQQASAFDHAWRG